MRRNIGNEMRISAILKWADGHRERTGRWPSADSGPVADASGETWRALNRALERGSRGLPGLSSLAKLLARHRGRAGFGHLFERPKLSVAGILRWADLHHRETARWPSRSSGAVRGQPHEKWAAIHACLVKGLRGLPGKMTLAGVLAKHRGRRSRAHLSPLTESGILSWADAYHERIGDWPNTESGAIPEAPGENWLAIDHAQRKGTRGLAGRSSLAKLLADSGRKSTPKHAPRLSTYLILKWGQAHRKKTGRFPTSKSGPVLDAPGENWAAIASALNVGARGLPEGLTLPGLWERYYGRRNPVHPPPLDHPTILKWADEHYCRTGAWPTCDPGPVKGQPGEDWHNIDTSLRKGQRGLPGGDSLARLLDRKRWQNRPGRRRLSGGRGKSRRATNGSRKKRTD